MPSPPSMPGASNSALPTAAAHPRRQFLAPLGLVYHSRDHWKFDGLRSALPEGQQLVELHTDHGLDASSLSSLQSCKVVFVKSKDLLVLESLEPLAAQLRFVNPIAAIRLSMNRREAMATLRLAGLPVPRDFWGALGEMPFERYVLKSKLDQNLEAPSPVLSANDHQELLSRLGASAQVYAQEWIASEWELKIYKVGRRVFAFKQAPTLSNPDKLATRTPLEAPQSLIDIATRALEAVGLLVGGVDFLGRLDTPTITDINSTQGLQNFDGGNPALAEALLRELDGK